MSKPRTYEVIEADDETNENRDVALADVTTEENSRGNASLKMAAYLQMFLFIFKSKYRRKWDLGQTIVCLCLVLSCSFCVQCKLNCSDVQCINGECVNGTCVCNEGWQGSACQFCGGKVR